MCETEIEIVVLGEMTKEKWELLLSSLDLSKTVEVPLDFLETSPNGMSLFS